MKNENKQEETFLYWETKMFALSQITGELTQYIGRYVEAKTFQQALLTLRRDGLDWLQLTGKAYDSIDEVENETIFYEKLTDPHNLINELEGYDGFMDWLDLATCREDLESAREAFLEAGGLEEYVKVIETQINLKYRD